MKVLVTGGAGYIGSHLVQEMLAIGNEVVVVDDFSNALSTTRNSPHYAIYETNILDLDALVSVVKRENVDAIFHLAAKKMVNNSLGDGIEFFETNLEGTKNVIQAVKEAGIGYLIFSSTAAVYGPNPIGPNFRESDPISPVNSYGESKAMAEEVILKSVMDLGFNALIFRFFNVAGAKSPSLMEHKAQNLIPTLIRNIKKGEVTEVFGTNLPTRDGSCIRDYIHVLDIVRAHILALDFLDRTKSPDASIIVNLGSGTGSTVFEVIKAMEIASGEKIPFRAAAARNFDPIASVASGELARMLLNFRPEYLLQEIVNSAWRNW